MSNRILDFEDSRRGTLRETQLNLAIKLTQSGKFADAIDIFKCHIESTEDTRTMTYYALCRAIVDRELKEAESICKVAIKTNPYSPDIFLNTAKILYIKGNRKHTVMAIQRGMKMDKRHKGLAKFAETIGMRSAPVIPFLSRDNFANVFLGKVFKNMRVNKPRRNVMIA
ncbi:MAG: hypothetical protein KAR06_01935 [Deltaproteobacteria bacterium]|nr:hypothetical protein [Deltaproteobacteria bacterium]